MNIKELTPEIIVRFFQINNTNTIKLGHKQLINYFQNYNLQSSINSDLRLKAVSELINILLTIEKEDCTLVID